ncbi:DnaD domain protein [Weissella cibaria]|uniref:DnaD domain protein n=1 Tax=Weissella cibaria TaxID=137591 RepID=UPI001E50F742|nr:DnaD domain protein [Weissella cibaria]MCC6121283.1 DnaD domain protein [Weissella cibaria]
MTEFSIRQRYRLIYDEPINLAAVQSLTKVYLPIIGRDAFTLYLNWAMLGESTDAANQHADLLDELAMSQQTFLTAREKLEGMGLLKTYQQETSFGVQWAYQLFPPMAMKAFLADIMLSSLLHHYLGDDLFERLIAATKPNETTIPGQNVSKSFFDMMGQESFQRLPAAPFQSDDTKSTLQREIAASNQQLNITLMADMLQSFGITQNDLRQNQADLIIQKSLYGLSDVELVRLIQGTVDASGKLSITNLRQTLRRTYEQGQRVSDAVQQVTESQPKATTPNEPVATGNPAAGIIQTARTTAPLVFLKSLRENAGGFVTDNEVRALNDIAQLDKIKSEVLNIMLFELTVVEKRTNLSKALLQTIVNDWAQAGVTTAVDAMTYLQKRTKQRQEKAQQSGKSGAKRWQRKEPVVKETRPDWENQKATAVSNEDATAAKNALAELRARRQQSKKE